ncbi:N-acetylmuramoyl-L-alanine amidase [Dongia sp.]|uniref:N-acetylmuramoyl-L-alanine amidase n=1 Tax=Dongia sp. TaxID=1977262 RepID=UPI0035B05831
MRKSLNFLAPLRFAGLRQFLVLLAALTGLAIGGGLSIGVAYAKPAVTDAKLGVEPDRTRVVLDLTAATGFKVFALADPQRVVIDLDEVDWQIPAGRKLQGRGLVAAMRYGLFKVGTSRIVLDLAAPAAVTQVTLLDKSGSDPRRLLIDLTPVDEAAFNAQVKRTLFAGDGSATNPSPATQTAAAASAPKEPALAQEGPVGDAGTPSSDPDPLAQTVAAKSKGDLNVPEAEIADAAILVPTLKPGEQGLKKNVKRKPLIVIDPGHGGIDPGAIGNGTMEKTITLAVAKALKKELLATGRFRVELTRDKDVYIPLRDRFKVARDDAADLFISLHADSHANSKTRGASVYTLSETASDSEAEALAAKENKSDVIAGVDLTNESKVVTGILIDLAQRETTNLSARFAKMLVKSLKRETLMLEQSHRFAGFAVLKAPDVPSVLLEMGYISSDEDQRLLTNKSHQKSLAKAIATSIQNFFDWQNSIKRI